MEKESALRARAEFRPHPRHTPGLSAESDACVGFDGPVKTVGEQGGAVLAGNTRWRRASHALPTHNRSRRMCRIYRINRDETNSLPHCGRLRAENAVRKIATLTLVRLD